MECRGALLLVACLCAWQNADAKKWPTEEFFASATGQMLSGHAGHAGQFGGMAVVDVDGDQHFELFVSAQRGKNRLLKWMTGGMADIAPSLGLDDDELRTGLGVAACDTDGDGVEEIYSISSSRGPGGRPEQGMRGTRQYSDRLYKKSVNDTHYHDALYWTSNAKQTLSSARVAACVDAEGSGLYDIYVGELGGGLRHLNPRGGTYSYVIDPPPVPSPKPGVPKVENNNTDRTPPQSFQAIAAYPFSSGSSSTDLFCLNSAGSNHLLMLKRSPYYGMLDHVIPIAGASREPATYVDRTKKPLDDVRGLARAVGVFDENGDGELDIIVGNSEPSSDFAIDANGQKHPYDKSGHLFFSGLGNGVFEDRTFPALREHPSRIRGIVIADFDNDGHEEIFMHNSATSAETQPNVLLKKIDGNWTSVPLGAAAEETEFATGAVAMDIDNDGKLELVLSHGDGKPSPLSIYRAVNAKKHNYLRILPLTASGAPARGTTVTLTELCGRMQKRVVDGGGSSLSQQEPIAHFGLGFETAVKEVRITWADGRRYILLNPRLNRIYRVEYIQHDWVDSSRGNAPRRSYEECTGLSKPGLVSKPRTPPVNETAAAPPRVPFTVPIIDCYNGTGTTYRGNVSRTVSGSKCQPWSNMFPNFHSHLPVFYPNSDLRLNYCRNPDGSESRPWCYTLDGNRTELCDVDKCPEVALSARALFEKSIMSEDDADECAKSPECVLYEMATCPARDIQAACKPGMIFQRLRGADGERCFCRKGRTVPCNDDDLNVQGQNSTCRNGTVLERMVTPWGTRCACMEYSSTMGIMGSLFGHQQAWRHEHLSRLPVKVASAFRACLQENQNGPLRCTEMMEKMGYPFQIYGNVSVSGPQEPWDLNDSIEREDVKAAADLSAKEKADDQADAEGKDEGDEGGDGSHEIVKVVDCPEGNHTDDICPEGTFFLRSNNGESEVCSCRTLSYMVACDGNLDPDLCEDGYRIELQSGSNCNCVEMSYEKLLKGEQNRLFLDGDYWHGGCEHCHYGTGKCLYDKDVGYYCACNDPNYEGDDCMTSKAKGKRMSLASLSP